MDLHYTLTAIPRDDPNTRVTKIQRVLPNLDEVSRMCREEIALGDLRPYVDWANGTSDDKFFEFDFVVVLKRRHEHLGFAFVHNNDDKTSLNVDIICANQKGKTVMECVFVLAGLLNRGQSYNVNKITLQAVPNVFGFYRKVGFKTVSDNSEPSPLDKLWDEMSGDSPKEGKPLSFSQDHLQTQIDKFKFLDGKKSCNQSSQHKILRSLFQHKGIRQSVTATMSELLESYGDILDIYDAIDQALKKIPRKPFDYSVPMEIKLTRGLMESLPELQRTLALKPHYDPELQLEYFVDPMGNSSDEEMSLESVADKEVDEVDSERTETDEEMQDQDIPEDSCAPTPTRYRTESGPNQSCPAEAQILEAGEKCCTSRPEETEAYPNPPSHPDTLRFLLTLRTVYLSSDSPQNIPAELQSTLTWINEYQSTNMIDVNQSNDSILFIPVNSTWLVTILKFAAMSLCNTPIGVYPSVGYRELYRKCHDGGACVTLYTDMRAATATLHAVNEVGVNRLDVIVSENQHPAHLQLPYLNALKVNFMGNRSIPVKLEDLMSFILKSSNKTETSSLTLNRPLISESSSPPHTVFSDMIKALQGTCGTRVIRFVNSPCRNSALPGFFLVNFPPSFLDLLGESLGYESRATLQQHGPYLSITYKQFKIFFRYTSDNIYLSITQKPTSGVNPKRKVVNQYNLDGTLHATYDGLRIAAEAVRGDKSAGAVRPRISDSILHGGEFQGFRWAFAGDALVEERMVEERAPKRQRTSREVSQFTTDGQFVRTYDNIREAAEKALGGIRGSNPVTLRRRIDDGRAIGGFRWAFRGEQLVTPLNLTPLGDSLKSNPVSQYTETGDFVRTYTSMTQVFNSFGLKSNMSRYLRQKIERGEVWKGYRWAFAGTPLIMN